MIELTVFQAVLMAIALLIIGDMMDILDPLQKLIGDPRKQDEQKEEDE